ncbi:MAG: DUF547 domain-containing protein [Alphaproteobacteria bacterium]|nr:DUF547 domain-containing protein [Alphaproteobacteria bacterium]
MTLTPFRPFAVLAFLFALMPAKADVLDQHFSTNNPSATMTVDHSAWERVLSAYVVVSGDGINRFAYGRVTAADKKALKAYLTALQGMKVTALKPDEQRAFWINLYNALTIDVVLDAYPVKTIKDISLGGGFFASGPWKKPLVSVEGKMLSLDNIEHDILRKVWRDARVHYAVNCASISCPNLMAKAFTAGNLDKMLTQGARDYVNHPRGVRVRAGKVTLSRIYSWYRSDFGASDAEVLRHVAGFAEPALKKQLADIDTIDGYDYDWSLNEAK